MFRFEFHVFTLMCFFYNGNIDAVTVSYYKGWFFCIKFFDIDRLFWFDNNKLQDVQFENDKLHCLNSCWVSWGKTFTSHAFGRKFL